MSDETTSAAHGSTIRLTLYSEAGAVATVALDLVRAVALAGPLGVRSGSRWSPAPQRSQLIDSTLATHAVRDFTVAKDGRWGDPWPHNHAESGKCRIKAFLPACVSSGTACREVMRP